jgi:hypothetical protein
LPQYVRAKIGAGGPRHRAKVWIKPHAGEYGGIAQWRKHAIEAKAVGKNNLSGGAILN